MSPMFVHSFNYFVLVRTKAHPEPIPGTLGMKQEYMLQRMPVHLRAQCRHSFTAKGNIVSPIHLLAWFGNGRKSR